MLIGVSDKIELNAQHGILMLGGCRVLLRMYLKPFDEEKWLPGFKPMKKPSKLIDVGRDIGSQRMPVEDFLCFHEKVLTALDLSTGRSYRFDKIFTNFRVGLTAFNRIQEAAESIYTGDILFRISSQFVVIDDCLVQFRRQALLSIDIGSERSIFLHHGNRDLRIHNRDQCQKDAPGRDSSERRWKSHYELS